MVTTKFLGILNAYALITLMYATPACGQDAVPTFESVRAVLEDNCTMCHNGPKAPKGLRLDTYDDVLKGSEDGKVVQAGNPKDSELIRRVRGISTPRMPLSGPPWLEESDIRLMEVWIENGALPGSSTSTKEPSTATGGNSKDPSRSVTFKDIGPILKSHCVKCHNTKGLMGPPPEGLVLASYRSVMNGNERVYVVPGNPDASELVRKVRGQSLPRMPLDGPPYLTSAQIDVIERWVEQGAMDESGTKAEIPISRRVRLRGTLSAAWALDGLPLGVSRGTEIKKRAHTGNYVEVRGRVTASGGIHAEEIRARRPSSGRNHD